jgi:signal transduction histidine kinase
MASLGNLVAGIAHEINTPIGAISSMHDTLTRAVEKLRHTLDTDFPKVCAESRALQKALKVISDANQVIATGTERVMKIVRSLRSFARLDEAELNRVDLHESIDNTLTLVHHDIKDRVEVVKDYGDVPPVVCYPSRLNQVFLNILVNASQAIEGEGEIHISTCVKDGKVRVAIRDTGAGIPEEDLKRIFDPGFTTKGVGVGTGLGLSICYQIMQDHEGEIQVESSVGEGSTFTVVFPADLDEVTQIP